MNKNNNKVYLNIGFTLITALCISVIIIISYRGISNIAVDDCFQKLWDQTGDMRDELKKNMDNDTRLLETIGEMLADVSNIEEAGKLLRFEKSANFVEQVELLFSDGRILGSDGRILSDKSILDYEKEAAAGAHITGKMNNPDNIEDWIIYNIVPAKLWNGEEVLLCGKISLNRLQESYENLIEDNGSRFHLIEAHSSELLIDTVHYTPGKTDSVNKKMKKSIGRGDSIETIKHNMSSGIPGEIAFYSSTVQEFLYGVYNPVGIQDWCVLLCIPESIAFDSAKNIKIFFLVCAAMEAFILMIYFTILLFRSRKMASELEEQYNTSQELRGVQELLFHSVIRPEKMTLALKQLAKMLTAKRVYLCTYLNHNGPRIYSSASSGEEKLFSSKNFISMMSTLKEKGQIFFSNVDELQIEEDEKEKLRDANIKNGMAIILKDSDERCQGVIFAVNMDKEWYGAEPLEWIRFDFSMALDNIAAFQRIRELGSRDQLTGLLNRNSYQKAIEVYERMDSENLSCIYIDADGLHELNNKLGHIEGDRMLMSIAQLLLESFGNDTVYRIGGDEFIVLCSGIEDNELERRVKKLNEDIINAGYHVSLGKSDRKEAAIIGDMVRLAEGRMYEAKRQYYRERKNGQKVRELNHQLEATLLEKRDLDAFCSVLEYKYIGVYIVNLSMDTLRAINIPEYFQRNLEMTGGKYSEAIKLYTDELVTDEYHSGILGLLDYEKLFAQLSNGEKQELIYLKRDGSLILLKIYPTPDFDEFQKECIWTFEVIRAEQ